VRRDANKKAIHLKGGGGGGWGYRDDPKRHSAMETKLARLDITKRNTLTEEDEKKNVKREKERCACTSGRTTCSLAEDEGIVMSPRGPLPKSARAVESSS